MFRLLVLAAIAGLLTGSTALGGDTRYAQGTPMPIPPSSFAWLGPQPEPPDYPAHAAVRFPNQGVRKLGPQPEPPDFPVISYEYEMFLEWMFGLPMRRF